MTLESTFCVYFFDFFFIFNFRFTSRFNEISVWKSLNVWSRLKWTSHLVMQNLFFHFDFSVFHFNIEKKKITAFTPVRREFIFLSLLNFFMFRLYCFIYYDHFVDIAKIRASRKCVYCSSSNEKWKKKKWKNWEKNIQIVMMRSGKSLLATSIHTNPHISVHQYRYYKQPYTHRDTVSFSIHSINWWLAMLVI